MDGVGTHREHAEVTSPERARTIALRWAPWAIVAAVWVVGMLTASDYGATTDEPWRMLWTRRWWEVLGRGDTDGFAAMPLNYGFFYDALGRLSWLFDHHWLGGDDEFRLRRVLNLTTGCLALLGTHRLARQLAGERVALVALLLLATCPRFYGSAFSNPKDIPFAAAAIWSAWAIVRVSAAPSRRHVIVAALLAGICAAVRPHGVVLIFVGALAAAAFAERTRLGPWRALGRALGFVLLAYSVCFVLWPVLWVQPPWHLITASIQLSRHDHGSVSLFAGDVHPFTDAPGAYVVGWLAITLPPAVAIAAPLAIVGLVVAALRNRPGRAAWFGWGLLVLWVVGPSLVPMLRRTTLYDADRQLAFMVPVCCILAAWAWTQLARLARRGRLVVWATLAACTVASVVQMVHLHPYQKQYFSPLVGGLPGAHLRFDVATYSSAYREGLQWLAAHDPHAAVHIIGNGSAVGSYYAWKLGLDLNPDRFEYFLSEVRQGWEHTLPGRTVHVISRDGVPLLQIVRVDSMTAAAHGWVRSGHVQRPGTGGPSLAQWRALEARAGRFAVREELHDGPGAIALPFEVREDGEVTLLLCYYVGLRLWIDGELVYDGAEIPFQYRGTENFPSLHPITTDLRQGTHWLVADLTHSRQAWRFGVFAQARAIDFDAAASYSGVDSSSRNASTSARRLAAPASR